MGRQIQFHVLPADMRMLLDFVQKRDPVVVTLSYANSAVIEAISDPSQETGIMTLWNQSLLSSLVRKHVVIPKADHYVVDGSLAILELSPSRSCKWHARPALVQGRIYASFDNPVDGYEKWYNAIARWIRAQFIKNTIPPQGYIGPAAYEWHKKGGILLPSFEPPLTTEWLSWVAAQDQHRGVFS